MRETAVSNQVRKDKKKEKKEGQRVERRKAGVLGGKNKVRN